MKTVLGSSETDNHFLLRVMAEADTNGDGEIDFEEFSSYIVKHLARESQKGYKLHNRI